MKVAGIDVGSLTSKIVVLENGEIFYQNIVDTQGEVETEVQRMIELALRDAGLSLKNIGVIVSTGVGRKSISSAQKQKTTPTCLARGASFLFPSAGTVIDVGAENCTVVRINEKGKLQDYTHQGKCAAGSGIFLQGMAKIFKMSLEEMAKKSLKAQQKVEVNSTCAVFAEQEVISLVHSVPPTPTNDIIAGIHHSLTSKTIGLAKKVGIKPDLVLCGGVAVNIGFVQIIKEELETTPIIPEKPQVLPALGAALFAWESL